MLHLTANENIMSNLAMRFFNSSLSQRYNMGSGEDGVFVHSNFAAKGMPEVESLISSAEKTTKELLAASYVNLNCLSGIHAMMCSILSVTNPGETVMTVSSKHGGHFCTSGILHRTGRKHIIAEYDYKNYTFDAYKTAETFKAMKAKAIYLDTSVVLKPHPIRELREYLGGEPIIIYDASHTLGLIMGGEFQSPLDEGADIITANTHKTLPGPHHGLLAFKDREFGERAHKIIKGSFYSSTHISSVLALAVTINEMGKWGKEYARQIIYNANKLGELLKERGINVREIRAGRFTESHQLHIYVDKNNKDIVKSFLDNNISVNTSRALGDKLFIRLGLQEVTRRGMSTKEMEILADLISKILNGQDVKEKVIQLNKDFSNKIYGYDLNYNETNLFEII